MSNILSSKNSSIQKKDDSILPTGTSNNEEKINKNTLHLEIELSETRSHISDNLIPETQPAVLESEKSQGNVKLERRVSQFFQASRNQGLPLKPLSCWKLSKGLILGIVFIIFFALVIIWIVFSGENFEPETKVTKINLKINNCTLKVNCTQGERKKELIKKTSYWSYNFFVLFSTVLIVLSIISFVFVSASCAHFCQRSEYPVRTTVLSSIFNQQNKRDSLYYLEKNEKMHLQKLYERRNTNALKSLNSNIEYSFSNLSSISKLSNFRESKKQSKRTKIPIIIVDESQKTAQNET